MTIDTWVGELELILILWGAAFIPWLIYLFVKYKIIRRIK